MGPGDPHLLLGLWGSLCCWVSPHPAGSSYPSPDLPVLQGNLGPWLPCCSLSPPDTSKFLPCPGPAPHTGLGGDCGVWSGACPYAACGRQETAPCWGSSSTALPRGPPLLWAVPTSPLHAPLGSRMGGGLCMWAPRAWREHRALCLWPDVSPPQPHGVAHLPSTGGLGGGYQGWWAVLCPVGNEPCPLSAQSRAQPRGPWWGGQQPALLSGLPTCSSPAPSSKCPSTAQTWVPGLWRLPLTPQPQTDPPPFFGFRGNPAQGAPRGDQCELGPSLLGRQGP